MSASDDYLEVLFVENFLTINRATVEIKDVNIIIGRQAQGKSIIAKLSYFFSTVSEEFISAIREHTSKRELDANLSDKFESYFPRYAWEGSDFSIKYKICNIEICVTGEKSSKNKTKLKIKYSDKLTNTLNSKKKLYKKKLEEISGKEALRGKYQYSSSLVMLFQDCVHKPLMEGELGPFFSNAVFIPASRSFFANVQKNIFTFLSTNIEIDPFIKEFGSTYESIKRFYKSEFISRSRARKKSVMHELDHITQNIVNGLYEYSEEQDWIVSGNRRVNLANASSGQQEALPMLLMLCVWPFVFRNQRGNAMMFVEEPEAHLFPDAQSKMVSAFSLLAMKNRCKIFITTHSPYILTAFNNLTMAFDAIADGKINIKDFEKINGSCAPIPYERISAYTISNGALKNIKDDDNRMVGGDVLDKVSEDFENVVEYLMSLDD